ncbi:VOC family protein [Actinacidiphila glaucinigra]|uniref:VOC family protein n=1 Tax=Actinacidiphila glaucinigra TaxID=235986 RepID=UPI002DDAA1DB|nr:VOC family protein [Actinacidiphila glaucinigra]WSD61424.1 VOC family protein [Actinacidiphila glaucinigra]
MSTQIFVNLPVQDLPRAKAFFGGLGFSFDDRFTDDNAACLVIGEGIFAMLLVEPFFRQFTRKEVADATKTTEAIVCLGVESRERVDELADTALATGGFPSNEPMEQGPMYGRSFQDPDGHLWEVVYMDAAAFQG